MSNSVLTWFLGLFSSPPSSDLAGASIAHGAVVNTAAFDVYQTTATQPLAASPDAQESLSLTDADWRMITTSKTKGELKTQAFDVRRLLKDQGRYAPATAPERLAMVALGRNLPLGLRGILAAYQDFAINIGTARYEALLAAIDTIPPAAHELSATETTPQVEPPAKPTPQPGGLLAEISHPTFWLGASAIQTKLDWNKNGVKPFQRLRLTETYVEDQRKAGVAIEPLGWQGPRLEVPEEAGRIIAQCDVMFAKNDGFEGKLWALNLGNGYAGLGYSPWTNDRDQLGCTINVMHPKRGGGNGVRFMAAWRDMKPDDNGIYWGDVTGDGNPQLEIGHWYTLKLDVDLGSGSIELYCDGQLSASRRNMGRLLYGKNATLDHANIYLRSMRGGSPERLLGSHDAVVRYRNAQLRVLR